MSESQMTESVAQRFRRLREAAGLTKTALASPAYTTSYVSQIESGRRSPSPDAIGFFAGKLGVAARYLSTGIPDGIEDELRYRLESAAHFLQQSRPDDALQETVAVLRACLEYGLDEQRGVALAINAQCLVALGRVREGIDRYEDALEAGLPERTRGMVIAALAATYRDAGDLAYGADLIESYLRVRREQPLEAGVAAELNAVLISIYYERGDMLRAERAAERALHAAEGGDSPHVRADALWNASRVLAEQGRYDEALELARRARVILDDIGDHRRIGLVHSAYAFLCIESEPPLLTEAARHLDTAESLLEESGAAGDLASVFIERARLALMSNRHDEVVDVTGRALAHVAGDDLRRGRALLLRGRALGALTRFDEALDTLLEASSVFNKLGARQQEASCWREIGELQLGRGAVDEAVASLRSGLAALEPHRSRA